MHLDEETVQRLVHGELSGTSERSVREHLTGCDVCRRLVTEAEREDAEAFALLRELDDPVPRMSAETIAARARARGWDRVRVAAGFAIALGLAGAAYAVPGSPLRAWVTAATQQISDRRAPSPPPPTPQQAPEAGIAGIAVVPGPDLLILFTSRQVAGQARVSMTDDVEVAVHAPNGAATFTSGVDRLVIDNRGSSATFEIRIPRTAPRVEIQVEGRRLFLKQGPRLITEASADPSGGYLLPLAPPRP